MITTNYNAKFKNSRGDTISITLHSSYHATFTEHQEDREILGAHDSTQEFKHIIKELKEVVILKYTIKNEQSIFHKIETISKITTEEQFKQIDKFRIENTHELNRLPLSLESEIKEEIKKLLKKENITNNSVEMACCSDNKCNIM